METLKIIQCALKMSQVFKVVKFVTIQKKKSGRQTNCYKWLLEDLKCLGALATTCRHKARDINTTGCMEEMRRKRKHSACFTETIERMRKGHC